MPTRTAFSAKQIIATILFVLGTSAWLQSAHALPTMAAFAGPTHNQGFSCAFGSDTHSIAPSFLPQSATSSCFNVEGNLFASANASFGSLNAFASAFSQVGVNLGSESAASVEASASFSSTGVFASGPGVTGTATVTYSGLHFSAHATATDSAGSGAVAFAILEGFTDEICDTTVGCVNFGPVTVPLNTPVPYQLRLDVDAFANASGQLTAQQGIADASHTFSFVSGRPVFDLPPGVTFNDPASFIFDNIFAPPGSGATVPEPASLALLAIALAGLVGVARFRRQLPRRQRSAPA